MNPQDELRRRQRHHSERAIIGHDIGSRLKSARIQPAETICLKAWLQLQHEAESVTFWPKVPEGCLLYVQKRAIKLRLHGLQVARREVLAGLEVLAKRQPLPMIVRRLHLDDCRGYLCLLDCNLTL